MMHTFVPTGTCCDRRIRKEMQRETLQSMEKWTCPVCGCDWLPREFQGMILWEAHPVIMVFR